VLIGQKAFSSAVRRQPGAMSSQGREHAESEFGAPVQGKPPPPALDAPGAHEPERGVHAASAQEGGATQDVEAAFTRMALK
jgi:hypothetical protein